MATNPLNRSRQELEDRVATLEAAKLNPAASLTYENGRAVRYRDLDDLERQYKAAVRELKLATGQLTRKRRTNRFHVVR